MMIGIGTPSNQRSAPLAMIASVVATDNGANLVAVPHPVNRAPPGRTRKEGRSREGATLLLIYDRCRGKGSSGRTRNVSSSTFPMTRRKVSGNGNYQGHDKANDHLQKSISAVCLD